MAFRPHPFPVSAPALLPLLAALCTCTACGLIDDAREEQSRYEYIVFSDKPFETYCLETWDLNGDGRISRYEAQRVRSIDCSGRGIASLFEIGEFENLESLDCSRNENVTLDVSGCSQTLAADLTDNPQLELVYAREGQNIRAEGATEVIYR